MDSIKIFMVMVIYSFYFTTMRANVRVKVHPSLSIPCTFFCNHMLIFIEGSWCFLIHAPFYNQCGYVHLISQLGTMPKQLGKFTGFSTCQIENKTMKLLFY